MKKVNLLGIVLAVVVIAALLIAGCAQPTAPSTPTTPTTPTEPAAKEKVFELKYAVIDPMEDPFNKVVRVAWINWIEKESNGRIKITLYPACQAAKASDTYDAVRTGIVDMGAHCSSTTPGRFLVTEVVTLPMVVKHPASWTVAKMLNDLYDEYPAIQAEYPDVKMLSLHPTGCSQVATTKKPIHTMEDWKGEVIIGLGKYGSAFVKNLGGVPESMDMSEYYDALAKGIVGGITGCYQGLQTFSWGETVNYATECGLMMDTYFCEIMNMNTWNSLPPDLQALFTGENAARLTDVYGYVFDKGDLASKDWLSEQMIAKGHEAVYDLPPAERDRWIQAALPVRDIWLKDIAAKGAPAQQMLDDAIKLGQKYSFDKTPVAECEKTLHEWGAVGY